MDRIRPSSNQKPSPQRPTNSSNGGPNTSRKVHQVSLSSKLLVVGVVLVGIAIAAALSVGAFANNDPGIKEDQYQAVFLDNGQVYFGRLSNINSSYVNLTDIYYLQVQQDGLQEGENNATADPQISLAKLGNELHGPEDVMYISRSKILFWENMKNDSDVVEAIINNTQQEEDSAATQPADAALPTNDTAGADQLPEEGVTEE
jgi:hypothetical protein